MGKKDLTDRQVEATILDKLARKDMWGGTYRPTESMIKWISNRLKRNGKRVRNIVDGIYKRGLLLFKKSGAVMALNPKKKDEILRIIEEELY
jgi:hypothetical protein